MVKKRLNWLKRFIGSKSARASQLSRSASFVREKNGTVWIQTERTPLDLNILRLTKSESKKLKKVM